LTKNSDITGKGAEMIITENREKVKRKVLSPIISHQPSNAKSEGINNVIRTVLK